MGGHAVGPERDDDVRLDLSEHGFDLADQALDRLVLDVRLPFSVSEGRAFSPDGRLAAAVRPGADGRARLVLRDPGVYGIVVLAAAGSAT